MFAFEVCLKSTYQLISGALKNNKIKSEKKVNVNATRAIYRKSPGRGEIISGVSDPYMVAFFVCTSPVKRAGLYPAYIKVPTY